MNFRIGTVSLALLLAGCVHYQPRPISPAEMAAHFDARSLGDQGLKTFLEKNLGRKFDSWPLKAWDFPTLELAAYYYQPSLAVARTQWQETRGSEITAAQHPNPTLTATPGYDFTATSVGMNPWIPAVSLDVPIETAGKRGYRKAQARHLSDSARLNIATAAWQVRSALRMSLLDFASARERESLLQKQDSIQERLTQSLNQQLQAGAVSSSEVSLIQIALAKSRLDLADARRQLADARVRVADSVGISVKSLDSLELNFDFTSPHATATELMSADARDQALKGRPDILASLSDYAASQSALQLEIAKQYPDIHFGPGYQFNNGDHQFTLALAAELPLFNQNQGPIAEAEARRATAAAHFLELQAKVITEIDRAIAAFRITGQNLSALESLASAQKRQNEAIEAQVKAGAADQQALLNSQLDLAASELVQLDGRVKLEQAFDALEDALRRPIDAKISTLTTQTEPLAQQTAKKESKH